MIDKYGNLIVFGLAAIILSLMACDALEKQDSFLEEAAETVLEDGLEQALGLENDELRNTIDLTPDSDEDKG